MGSAQGKAVDGPSSLQRGIAPDAKDPELKKELEVGITEFVTPNFPGFSGTLKKRYADFCVYEVIPSGEVLHLETLYPFGNLAANPQGVPFATELLRNFPSILEESAGEDTKDKDDMVAGIGDTDKSGNAEAFELSSDDEKLLKSFFDLETVKNVLELHKATLGHSKADAGKHKPIKAGPITDRQLRTKIHLSLRRIFSSRLETSTDADGYFTITAAKSNGPGNWKKGRQNRSRTAKNRTNWDELGGEYVHFAVYKENKDTMEVMTFLARALKVNPKAFQFAGTKDRRAITVQRASAYHVTAERLAGLNRNLRNAALGNFKYCNHGLGLGDLKGNEFIITLRDCHFTSEQGLKPDDRAILAQCIVSTAIDNLQEYGFINYYGLQRFGTFSSRTDTVGVKMLQGDFKGSVHAILAFSDDALAAATNPSNENDKISHDDKNRAKAINLFFAENKAKEALDLMPRKFSAETNIIRFLSRDNNSNDFFGALQSIPRNLRLMYVHSYQSYIWNHAAGARWKRFGSKVVEGDLVIVPEQEGGLHVEDTIDADGEIVVHPQGEERAVDAEDRFERAKPLTFAEATSGKYTIFDVVLPLPGYDVEYPTNMIDFYRCFMNSEEGGGLDPLQMRRKWKDISLSGGYRKLVCRPGPGLSFSIHQYRSDDEKFVESDLELLKKENVIIENSCLSIRPVVVQTGIQPEGTFDKKIAVVLKMQLGTSQYATMALRELSKAGGIRAYKPDFGGGR